MKSESRHFLEDMVEDFKKQDELDRIKADNAAINRLVCCVVVWTIVMLLLVPFIILVCIDK